MFPQPVLSRCHSYSQLNQTANAFIINSCVKLCQRLFQDISLLICSSDDFDLPIFPSKMLLSSLPDYCNLHGMLNSIKKRKENKESLSRTIACELCRILPCDWLVTLVKENETHPADNNSGSSFKRFAQRSTFYIPYLALLTSGDLSPSLRLKWSTANPPGGITRWLTWKPSFLL